FRECGGGRTELLPVGVPGGGAQLVLRWDDAFGSSNHDYDLLLVTEGFASDPTLSADNPNIVAAATDLQNGGGQPREIAALELEEDQVLYAVVWHDPSSPLNSAQPFWLYTPGGRRVGHAQHAGRRARCADGRRRRVRHQRSRGLQLARPDGGRPGEAGPRR